MNIRSLKALEFNKILDQLVDRAESTIGKALVKSVYPRTDIEEIEKLQTETDEAVKLVLNKDIPNLTAIYELNEELEHSLKGGTLNSIDLLNIAKTLRTSRTIKEFLEGDESKDKRPTKLQELSSEITVLRSIESIIFKSIIDEDEISDEASVELKEIRRYIKNTNENVKEKLNTIINSTRSRKYLQDFIITVREGRYVVPVKQEYRSEFKGIIHDQSSSGATLFIEPMDVVRLNNRLKELQLNEKREIERILKELSHRVGEEAEEIKINMQVSGEIDFIMSKARLAVYMNGTRPNLTKDNYINIRSGRHPLIDRRKVVPIDFYLGKDIKTLVVTGPNTGGKTVTLKTVGLLTIMAQSGLQIPAKDNSTIAVFKNVYIDIGDEQSIEQNLSTFSSHMTNIVSILKNLEDNSLVLFDELGAGTDPTEGAALAIAILEYLKDREVLTIATTHYSELKLYALSDEHIENASVEFDVETLQPTYKLLIGVPGKSNAFDISKKLGLDNSIIDVAKNLISEDNVELEDILSGLEVDRQETEKVKEESKRLQLELEKMEEYLKDETDKFEEAKEKMIVEAKQEAREIITKTKRESDYILTEARSVWKDIEDDKKKKLKDLQEKVKNRYIDVEHVSDIFSKTSNEPLKSVREGDEVKIVSLNQIGVVLSEVDQAGNVSVRVGAMKLSVPLETLERTEQKAKEETRIYANKIFREKAINISTEIDVRGKNIDESEYEIDKYLDNAFLSGLEEVTIIHGKGTGVLKKGVENMLKRHKHVKSFREGVFGEGGTGVTVINIK